MRGEWCYFPQYFTAEQCDKIVAAGDGPWRTAEIGSQGDMVTDRGYRRSDVQFFDRNDARFHSLFRELWHLAIQANHDWFDVHITQLNYVQLARYDSAVQAEYREHHDVFWINNDPLYHRKLSVVVQLTDPNAYTGGDFELTDVVEIPPADVLRQQGTVIVFPSFLLHKANPVLTGTRYSLAAWFDGPKWR